VSAVRHVDPVAMCGIIVTEGSVAMRESSATDASRDRA
jgi:hypothetical protein